MLLAFSLQSDVKSIGAYAGFAAIIGLALLVLLYFAHARELRRMSDWLHEQEERLRNLPARAPMPRPVLPPPGPALTPPASPLSPEPAPGVMPPATPSATVAVPGARRVAVASIGTPGAAQPVGVMPAATVAGAIAAEAAAAPAAIETDASQPEVAFASDALPETGEQDVVAQQDVAASDAAVSPVPEGDERPQPPSAGEKPTPSAAVQLSASPVATAEPLGFAQAFEPLPAVEEQAGPPDTAETAIVPSFDPQSAISAERVQAGVIERDPDAAEPSAPPDLQAFEPQAQTNDDELAPLAPSTPAGARPRFPPAPAGAESRAMPVGATMRVAGAVAGASADAEAATTVRGGGGEPPASTAEEEFAQRPGGSTLRLAVAAIVIVAVLIFIATRVLGSSTSSGPSHPAGTPSPATVTVAVLNGTHTSGLATTVSSALSGLGFKQGAVANAASQDHHATLVSYITDAGHAAALEVAKDLAPTPTRVGPADPRTAALAEAQGATPTVVVTLGSDYVKR